MRALPADFSGDAVERFTGLMCPDCGGNLVVVRLGEAHLHFRCRVGHAYSLIELLSAKEERLEARLWGAVFAFEELGALLEDLIPRLSRPSDARLVEVFRRRREQGRAGASRLRQIIDDDEPLVGVDPETQREPGP
jgi:two-component system, chemotaxis family, protein-glutamate methylesterase/glutaminase